MPLAYFSQIKSSLFQFSLRVTFKKQFIRNFTLYISQVTLKGMQAQSLQQTW